MLDLNYRSSLIFKQSTQMLNRYVGSGGRSEGFNPLYQIGAPRSVELAPSVFESPQRAR